MFSTWKRVGVSASFRVGALLLAKRVWRTASMRFSTSGSCFNSAGDASPSHRHQRSQPLMNSSLPSQRRKYFAAPGSIIIPTNHIAVDVTNSGSVDEGVRWWEALTGTGGEGMVVKPLGFVSRNGRELLQPAVKCRGREYLRIIYGPEYTLEGNMKRLKKRSLTRKRSLALREFALGIEALERFVRQEPLYRVHECVFGVLALESEPVDPRL